MTHEKFTTQDVASLKAQCKDAIKRSFSYNFFFSADVTDINGHFDEDTGLQEIDIKIKFNKI